jgi:hypothetical protein
VKVEQEWEGVWEQVGSCQTLVGVPGLEGSRGSFGSKAEYRAGCGGIFVEGGVVLGSGSSEGTSGDKDSGVIGI